MRFSVVATSLLIFAASVSSVMGQGVADWQASAESYSPGFLATGISEPMQMDIGMYEVATDGGVTYEFIYNVPEIMGASSAFMGSLSAPDGQSAGLKLDQWPNSGTFGVTAFGVADYTSSTPHIVGADTHVVFVADGTDMAIYVNGAFAETLPAASIELGGLTGIGHAYNHGSDGSVDPLDGTLIGVARYDSALSAEAISANFAAYVPEPSAGSMMLVVVAAGLAMIRRRNR